MKSQLKNLGIEEINQGASTGNGWLETHGEETSSYSPTDGSLIAKVRNATLDDYEHLMAKAQEAYLKWRIIPAPKRGEVVRQIGEALRKHKEELGYLVTLEMGKIYEEGLGEVQEMIDICEFAVGQSRLLNGATMHSERQFHRMYDQYHPIGIVGIITSFNFPVAVWGWNAMLAAIAGDVVIWKPSSKTPLCAIAIQKIISETLRNNNVPEGVFNMIISKSSVLGDNFAADKRLPLVSVTGSTEVGRKVAEIVGKRLGKTILELGGNNAVIISKHADLDMTLQSVVFGAVGTCGQR
ncbi:MAG: aldehyde dehydrogenase family protein, partial [Bacteroidota bacterium]